MTDTTRRAFVGGISATVALPVDAECSPAALKASFLRWLEEAKPVLKVPIYIKQVEPDGIKFGFEGYTPTLGGWIGDRGGNNSGEMLIDAEYKDIWDGLRWPEDVCPVRRPGGWVCATCESEGHPVLFASAEAIWRDHLFDDLLKWVNETLAPATHLAFCDINGGYWVEVCRTKPADTKYFLPLKV